MPINKQTASGWIRFAVFELFCLVICFIIVGSAWRLGIFNEAFMGSGGLWKATSALFGLWFALSSVALIHYRWGMDAGIYIAASAIIASPIAVTIFRALFREDHDALAIGALALVSSIIGLSVSLIVVKAGEMLEDTLYPLFRLMDL